LTFGKDEVHTTIDELFGHSDCKNITHFIKSINLYDK